MGVATRPHPPPLPAPTETDEGSSGVETEVATNVTNRTSYSIPEDGSPITISTQKASKDGSGRHSQDKSQTSLLIEYFEASKTGDKSRNRPSVRVKVTPSAKKGSRGGSGHDAIQITGIGADRKPSYTRRISLGNSSKNVETGLATTEATEVSHSSESNVSARSPVEIEVLNGSDVSQKRSSRGLMYAPVESNVSSMPPESILETDRPIEVDRSRMTHHDDDDTTPTEYLKAPQRNGSRSRSASRERLTQKVMEKLGASPTATKPRKSSRSSRERGTDYQYESESRERRRHSSKSQRGEDDAISGAESSLLSSNPAASVSSFRSRSSQASRMTNNPKLLEMVEDTIKRMILPEINAIKDEQKEQKVDRKLRKYSDHSERESLGRQVSKSSSSPNIASKPKVVLNRDGDNPGTVLSRGDSERVKHRKTSREERPSSRKSSGRHSREGSHDDTEERISHKSSRSSNNGLRGAAAAGLAGGILTTAALKHHDSEGDIHHRKKRHSKSRSSRSRSASITDTMDDTYLKGPIPLMPMASAINESEVTRESILSQATDRPQSYFPGSMTPVHEVSRGSVGDSLSPASSRTPTRNSHSRGLGMSLANQSIDSPRSPKSPTVGMSNKARMAALTAAGLGGAAALAKYEDNHVDADGYGENTLQRKISSPVQSVSSLRQNFEDDPLIPQGLRPRSAASRSSAGRLQSTGNSRASLRSTDSPPSTKQLAESRKHSQKVGVDEFETPLERPDPAFTRERSGTPNGETAEEWFERQHLVNDQYRDSMSEAANRDSYQTNPYPQDEKRLTMSTDESYGDEIGGDKDVHPLGLNPNYVHTPVAVESAVASLMEPSTVSSHVVSSNGSASKSNGTYSDRMAEQLRNSKGREPPPMYEGSTLSQSMPSQDRWAAIKGHARNMSGSVDNVNELKTNSPRQQKSVENKPVMSSSGLPLAEDPMPEIGHYDSNSDLTTNPSIIQGHLGGEDAGTTTWPYTPEPQHDASNRQRTKDGLLVAAAGGAAALAANYSSRQPTVEDERDVHNGAISADREAMSFRDEGYATDGRTRSAGGMTPKAEMQKYGKKDLEEYERAMNAHDNVGEDPFTADNKHTRHFSGNSDGMNHGMESPLYDSSTGKGMDRIDSKDIVALMDHLTVRDAQRNARDTEILVTLVRSAAEMRSSFDEMKRFILEQDKAIMQNTDRGVDHTVQKVLSGPRPQPLGSPRTPRRQATSEEDVQVKRKGVLQRALKGLTGGKSAKDLARVEDMLMQILDNVEDLKLQGGSSRQLDRSYTNDSLDSYEKLRNAPDSGYEPEGQAGTSSTPSHSGHFNTTTPREKQQFHSGYDGRRGSEHRVSTVLEDDEDELEPHETHVLNNQFENNERMLTPTQERHRAQAEAEGTPEKQKKHKSNSSSLFGVPKISRWSRTTASSGAPDPGTLDSPQQARHPRPSSESSRSQSTLDQYDDDGYSYRDVEGLKTTKSFEEQRQAAHAETRSVRSQASKLTRTPSPLIPSEASSIHHDNYYDDEQARSPVQEDDEADHDDPKYHAHRNSILLQHPQPRAGQTPRHQNALETQAHTFDDPTGTNSDLSQRTVSDFDPAMWGSSGTAGLARHRMTQVEPISPVSMNTPSAYAGRSGRNEGPLVPQSNPAVPPKIKYEEPEPEDDWNDEPQFSNSGFSKGGYYSSPYGSGHLLEPIEEVRYSLETDSGHRSPEPQIASAKAVDMRSPARKITGPRPMGSRSPKPSSNNQARLVENTGTVRRKPVPGAQGSVDSLDSETF
ncbi:hypothetical protein CLAFUW4_04737 [Fulvia fulva]|uniref:Transaldolase n=1 Tax=Passalora fulva TaxID=5499 RepID=A0A9Q8PIV2_PASFU|nr:uncharacterized protein CLAFUR5_12162 [Fulvia fulva]KAK4627316.1 hypothetical protein CLAFUR4_04723 [Fulvia fulva]KAK4627423.1 hypothetical protein CLAFUR0_04727 [Fulvia fulva]UJO23210.1 hypothetical protein CLAFUR5_12162 [Fulvia fulva]WPV14240.1 hypothetical protein CLAFUW4_04737 [Fulvia fulva]WPV28085.1 hypothetical protein CLAFUW7_04731 [Fulvia fulva]